MRELEVTVPARAGLAGNPSDLYGGAVLAVPVASRAVTLTLDAAPTTTVTGSDGGERLIGAVLARVAPDLTFRVTWASSIPRSVGLAGSSAIVIAAIKAVDAALGRRRQPLELARLALEIERDDLGIVSGLQDRAVQSFCEPVLVDVSGPAPTVTVLRPAHPLHIGVGWLPAAAGNSGLYHRRLKATLGEAGAGMRDLADSARAAAAAFIAGEPDALRGAMTTSAQLRAELAPLPPDHQAMAEAVAIAGFTPHSAGSGGAVAAVLDHDSEFDTFAACLTAIGGDAVLETFR